MCCIQEKEKGLVDTTDLKLLAENEIFCIALSEAFRENFETDDEKEFRRGKWMLKAQVSNDIETMLIALCGYSFETLINMAKQTTEEIYRDFAVIIDADISDDDEVIHFSNITIPLFVYKECVNDYIKDAVDEGSTLKDAWNGFNDEENISDFKKILLAAADDYR